MGDLAGVLVVVLAAVMPVSDNGDDAKDQTDACELDREWPGW